MAKKFERVQGEAGWLELSLVTDEHGKREFGLRETSPHPGVPRRPEVVVHEAALREMLDQLGYELRRTA
ncbi:MAG: hypothetical protein JOZ41_18440 [Chloroflexi bacterium]|nr:hypothetical protein [Chloroflexota bacterium]